MKTLNVDGVNYNTYMAKRGYSVGYNKVTGPNSCMTLDGVTHEDIIAEKAIVAVSLKPLNDDNLSVILNVQSKKFVVVTYYDPKTKTDRTTNMRITTTAQSISMENSLSVLWGNGSGGSTLTLEEV